jgi:hypothetical protein
VAATEVDVDGVDGDAIEVEGGSVKADVAAGVFGVVVDSTDPAEEQALNARLLRWRRRQRIPGGSRRRHHLTNAAGSRQPPNPLHPLQP